MSLAGWFAPLLAHNLNQQHALSRAVQARAAGLDPKEFGTVFPGSNVTTTNHVSGGGWVKGWLAGLLALILGGAGVLGLTAALRAPATTPVAAPAPAAPPKPTEYEVRFKLRPDGQWEASATQVPPGSER